MYYDEKPRKTLYSDGGYMRKIFRIIQEVYQMGLWNFTYRCYYEILQRCGVLQYFFPKENMENIGVNWKKVIQHKNQFFFTEKESIIAKNSVCSQAVSETLRQANKLLKHEMLLFGQLKMKLGANINWCMDPISSKEWDKKHWSLIDISNLEMGDVKYTWDVNRHQHLMVLGRAFSYTQDEIYARECISQITSWIEQNPHQIGVNWYSNLEISLRLISWLWVWHFIKLSKFCTVEFEKKMFDMAYLHAKHLENNLNFSRYCVRNDHIIGDVTGMLMFAIVFPTLPESRRWISKAVKILDIELYRQFSDDGVYFAYSSNYQRFVIYFYLQAIQLLEINQYKIPDGWKPHLEKACHFIKQIMMDDGRLPRMGENDGGVALLLHTHDYNDYRPLLLTASRVLGIPDLASPDSDEEVFWFSGQKPQISSNCEIDLPEMVLTSSYQVLNNKEVKIVFHCGSNTSGYGHADMLHIDYAFAGNYIITDGGTFLYNGPSRYRNYFKGTAAHNTVCIDSEEQMINHRKFKWLSWTKANLGIAKRGGQFQFIEGCHRGYRRLSGGVIHHRAVLLLYGKYTLIFDRIIGEKTHTVDLNWHFESARSSSSIERNNCHIVINDNVSLHFAELQKNNEINIISGEDNEKVSGWGSDYYGQKMPRMRVTQQINAELPVSLGTMIFSNKDRIGVGVKYEFREIDASEFTKHKYACAFLLSSQEFEAKFIYIPSIYGTGSIRVDGIKAEGNFVCVTRQLNRILDSIIC